jgi:hypothetical protein
VTDLALATITQVGTATQPTMAVLDGATTATNVWPGSEVVTVGERVVLEHVGNELYVIGARKLSPVYHEEQTAASTITKANGWENLAIGPTTTKGNQGSHINSLGYVITPVDGVYDLGMASHTSTVTSASQRMLIAICANSGTGGGIYAREGTSGTVVNADLQVSVKKWFAAGTIIYYEAFASGNFVGASLITDALWATLIKAVS